MPNVWRIGSDYGGKDALPYFKKYKVVFAGEPHSKYNQIQKGDIIAITKGQKIKAIAKARQETNLSQISKELSENFDDILGVLVDAIYCEEDFDIDFGEYNGQGKQFHQAHNEYKENIEHLFSKLNSLTMTNNLKAVLSKEKQLILQGPPGTGKTREAKKIANWMMSSWKVEKGFESEKSTGEDDRGQVKILNGYYIKLIQFHPAYSYDDFVRGLVPEPEGENITFKPQDKHLIEIAKKAYKGEEKYFDNPPPFILIIDEINRANLPEVLGELIYALEYRGNQVHCLYPNSFENGNYKITLPRNLYIIGTMNTADRSVGRLDYAIRRRFIFEHLSPNREVINTKHGQDLFEDIAKIFKGNNDQENGHLSPEFDYDDVMIGHSYFMVNDKDENGDEVSDDEKKQQLQNNLHYKIKPILREYAKEGVLIDNGGDVMNEIEILDKNSNKDNTDQ